MIKFGSEKPVSLPKIGFKAFKNGSSNFIYFIVDYAIV